MVIDGQEVATAGTGESATSTEQPTSVPVLDAEGKPVLDAEGKPVLTKTKTDGAGSEPEGGDKGGKVVKELIHVRRRAQTAEQEAAYWKGVAEGTIKRDPERKPVVDPNAEPQPSQFDNYDDYITARAVYRIRKEDEKGKGERDAQTRQQQAFQKLNDAADADAELADLMADEDRWNTLPLSEIMFATVTDGENIAGILKYLDKNRKEAKRISQMTPLAAAREIGKIEVKLAGTTKDKETETKESISMAPKPPTTVQNNRAGAPVDLENMPMDEFVKHRNKQQYGKG